MATIKHRLFALEAEREKSKQQKVSAELVAAVTVARKWYEANGCRRDLQPREDMSEIERIALCSVLEVAADLEDNY